MYCNTCLTDFEKHKHKCSFILDKITELDAAWNTQKEAFNRITTGAAERYQKQETLITYFEHEMLIVSFSALSGIVVNQARSISDDV